MPAYVAYDYAPQTMQDVVYNKWRISADTAWFGQSVSLDGARRLGQSSPRTRDTT